MEEKPPTCDHQYLWFFGEDPNGDRENRHKRIYFEVFDMDDVVNKYEVSMC